MTKPVYVKFKDERKLRFSKFFKRHEKVKPITLSALKPEENFYERTGVIFNGNDEITLLLNLL
mgnify:CR=1 FL=1